MKFAYDLQGNSEILRDVAVYGAGVDIVEGAVVMRGATPGTNGGQAIVGAATYVDVIGVLKTLHDYSVVGDSAIAGTSWVKHPVIINPFAVYNAEYDVDSAISVASSSTTTVTITSLEDNIDAGWLYAVAGTGIGRLEFLTSSGSGTCTTKAASGWDSTTTVIKILPQWHELVDLTTAGTLIKTAAAAATGTLTVLENYIEADSIGKAPLDPTVHSGLTGLNSRNVKFSADIIFRNHVLNTLD